jgi:hypothetical protein
MVTDRTNSVINTIASLNDKNHILDSRIGELRRSHQLQLNQMGNSVREIQATVRGIKEYTQRKWRESSRELVRQKSEAERLRIRQDTLDRLRAERYSVESSGNEGEGVGEGEGEGKDNDDGLSISLNVASDSVPIFGFGTVPLNSWTFPFGGET